MSLMFYRIITSLFLMVALLFMVILGEYYFPEKYFRDSYLLLMMAEGLIEPLSSNGSYYYTAKFIEIIGVNLINYINIAIGVLFIIVISKYAVSLKSAIFLIILIAPHLVLGMSRPQKEILVTLLVMGLMIFKDKIGWKVFLFMVIFLYAAYGFVRSYYLAILLIYLYLIWFYFFASKRYKKISIYSIILLIFLLPSEVFFSLQGTRDIFNDIRVSGVVGSQTMYLNPYIPDGALNFILNYISAFYNFNISIFSNLSLEGIFLQFYVLIIFYYSYISLTKKNIFGVDRALSLLLLSHMAVLLLFEPDLGSYMRHLSSVSAFIFPVLYYQNDSRS